MSTPKLMIYDLDGTLVDAFDDIAAAINHALAAQGLPTLGPEAIRRFVGDGALRLAERSVAEAQRIAARDANRAVDVRAVSEAFIDHYEAHPAVAARVYPGAMETLKALRGRGIRQAILTNKPEGVARELCTRLGLLDYLDGLWGAREEEPLKPDPESALRIVRHFGLKAHECVMVGDGPADHAVARASEMRMFGVAYGQMAIDDVRAANPEYVIQNFAELLNLMDE